MRVYRCIKLYEIISMYKNEKNKKFYNSDLNTHVYDEGKEYIHFFKYNNFANYYFDSKKEGYDKENDNFILFMTANIPNEILEKYKGFGFYSLNGEEILMPEYAIPVEEFSSDYIVDITDKPIGLYIRKNETEEYMEYLELIKNLKQTTKDVRSIAMDLLKIDLDKLLGIETDNRSEKEIEREFNTLLLNQNIPESNDNEIKKLGI